MDTSTIDWSTILPVLPLALLALPLSIVAAPAALVAGYVGLGTTIYSTLLAGPLLLLSPLLAPLLIPLVGCPSCQIPPFQWRY
jgi:hypothetical protein